MADDLEKLNPTPSSQEIKLWELESGQWEQESSGKGFKLVKTNTGQKVSNHLTNADLQVILNLPKHPENEDWLYPPEFKYCTETGEELLRQDLSEEKAWIPPFGVLPINERKAGVVRGLNQSDFGFEIDFKKQESDSKIEEKVIRLPGSGNFQFFSIKAKTEKNILIAIDPAIGAIYAFLPHENTWEFLKPKGVSLSETSIDLSVWRCEAIVVNNQTELYIPTNKGLAKLLIDFLCLKFEVEYLEEINQSISCIASPAYFLDSIWQLIKNPVGKIQVIQYSRNNEIFTTKNVLDNINISNFSEITNIQAPIVTNNQIIWICDQGQIIVQHVVDTNELMYLKWPEHIKPEFKMGCPYLDTGNTYQLCLNTTKRGFCYVLLNDPDFAENDCLNKIRTCSGSINYRTTNREKTKPWDQQGVPDESQDWILPLVESHLSPKNVLAIKLDLKDKTLLTLLDKKNKQPISANIILDGNNSNRDLTIINVDEPWQLKFFIYENYLWFYHYSGINIKGWSLK